MQYAVSWWEGENKQHRVLKDEETAQKMYKETKTRSVTLPRVSLEPVRIMPLIVFEKMNTLVQTGDSMWQGRCKHSPYKRLCTVCVGEAIL